MYEPYHCQKTIIEHPLLPIRLDCFDGFSFVNVRCISRICFNCSQHAMFTTCILFSILTTETQVIGTGEYKKTNPQTQRILPLQDRASGSEIPGSATDFYQYVLCRPRQLHVMWHAEEHSLLNGLKEVCYSHQKI